MPSPPPKAPEQPPPPPPPPDRPPPPPGEVGDLFEGVVDGIRRALLLPRRHRHQDQYQRPIEAALELAKSKAVVEDIDTSYRSAVRSPDNQRTSRADAAEVVRKELEAFPLAVQIHEAEEKMGTAKPGAVSRLRTEAKTILRSVNDVFHPSDIGKNAVLVLIEAIDLAGDD